MTTTTTCRDRVRLMTVAPTLDGIPASICGYSRDFATIRTLDGRMSAEWAWPTVERIMNSGGSFKL